jgi:DHA1 family multidrug resistance protein-like MFS transporter
LALVAVFGEAAYAVVNILGLPAFVDQELEATVYLGLIGGSFLLTEALLKGPMGHLSDRIGRRVLLIVAPIGSALAAAGVTLAHAPFTIPQLIYLIAVRAVDGVAAAALWTTMYAAVADAVPEERRASAMSTLTVSYLVGVAVGPKLGGWAATRYSLRAPFYLVSGLFCLASITALLVVPRRGTSPRTSGEQPLTPSPGSAGAGSATTGAHPHHDASEGSPSLTGFFESLQRAPQYILLALVVFSGVGLLYNTAPLLARHQFGLDWDQFGNLFFWPAVIIGLLSIPLGHLGDRWGSARSVQIGMAMAALALWALALLPKTEMLLVLGASALGLGFVIGLPAWIALISRLADPQHRGAMIGAVATAQGLGAFLGVLIGPMLFKASRLAALLDPIWPGRLTASLLPVLGSAVLLTLAFFASTAVVREPVECVG